MSGKYSVDYCNAFSFVSDNRSDLEQFQRYCKDSTAGILMANGDVHNRDAQYDIANADIVFSGENNLYHISGLSYDHVMDSLNANAKTIDNFLKNNSDLNVGGFVRSLDDTTPVVYGFLDDDGLLDFAKSESAHQLLKEAGVYYDAWGGPRVKAKELEQCAANCGLDDSDIYGYVNGNAVYDDKFHARVLESKMCAKSGETMDVRIYFPDDVDELPSGFSPNSDDYEKFFKDGLYVVEWDESSVYKSGSAYISGSTIARTCEDAFEPSVSVEDEHENEESDFRDGRQIFMLDSAYDDSKYAIFFEKTSYAHGGGLAVQAYVDNDLSVVEDGDDPDIGIEPWNGITVNLGTSFGDTMAYVDTNNNGQNMMKLLEENGLVEDTGIRGYSGFCEYPLCHFTDKFFEAAKTDTERRAEMSKSERDISFIGDNFGSSEDVSKDDAYER